MDNKVRNKIIFWEIVNEILGTADIVSKDHNEEVTAIGAAFENGSILFDYDTNKLELYDNENKLLMELTEDDDKLVLLKEVYESVMDV